MPRNVSVTDVSDLRSYCRTIVALSPRGLQASHEGCIDRRMPRMQVYLPEAMYKQVKARGLPVSELLQKAVQAELRRLDLLAETDRYLADLIAEVGAPGAAQRARAGAVARRLSQRATRKAGDGRARPRFRRRQQAC